MATARPVSDLRWVVGRLLAAALVVFLTYNPTGYSYLHWLFRFEPSLLALKAFVGLLLVILLQLYFHTTYGVFRLSGLLAGGVTAALASHFALFYVLLPDRLQSFDGYVLWLSYLVPMTLAVVIGFGLSWGRLMSRLSGQEYKRYLDRQ